MRLLWLTLTLITPLWLGGSLVLLFTFSTLQGKAAAAWTLLPLVTLWAVRFRPRRALGLLVLCALSFLGLLSNYPRPPQGDVRSTLPFPSLADRLCNFVPERDLATLGVCLAYGGETRRRVRGLLDPLYAEMAADAAYTGLPHVVGSVARDLLGGGPGPLQDFRYLPPSTAGKQGALVFYHGALGDFQVYLHFWRRWARKRGWIVICPSNGFGRWYTADGQERALDSLQRALADAPIDPHRLLVVGMSNGATAATSVVNLVPNQVGALLLVCPVLESQRIRTPVFLDWSKSHPLIVVEGTADQNVPAALVTPRVKEILDAGGRCDYRLLEGHDHHILFSADTECYAAADELADALERETPEDARL